MFTRRLLCPSTGEAPAGRRAPSGKSQRRDHPTTTSGGIGVTDAGKDGNQPPLSNVTNGANNASSSSSKRPKKKHPGGTPTKVANALTGAVRFKIPECIPFNTSSTYDNTAAAAAAGGTTVLGQTNNGRYFPTISAIAAANNKTTVVPSSSFGRSLFSFENLVNRPGPTQPNTLVWNTAAAPIETSADAAIAARGLPPRVHQTALASAETTPPSETEILESHRRIMLYEETRNAYNFPHPATTNSGSVDSKRQPGTGPSAPVRRTVSVPIAATHQRASAPALVPKQLPVGMDSEPTPPSDVSNGRRKGVLFSTTTKLNSSFRISGCGSGSEGAVNKMYGGTSACTGVMAFLGAGGGRSSNGQQLSPFMLQQQFQQRRASTYLSVSSTAYTALSTGVVPSRPTDRATDRATLEKEWEELFLVFTRVLMIYLEQRDPAMHAKAKAVINAVVKEGAEMNKAGVPHYSSLTRLQTRMKEVVGDTYWAKAERYLYPYFWNELIDQGRAGGQSGSSSGGTGGAGSAVLEPLLPNSMQLQRRASTSSYVTSTASTAVSTGAAPSLPTDRATLEKQRKEQFLWFTHVLMKYLEKNDAVMHAKAKAVIKECVEKVKAGVLHYSSLTSLPIRLKEVVGDAYWAKADQYLYYFLQARMEIARAAAGCFPPPRPLSEGVVARRVVASNPVIIAEKAAAKKQQSQAKKVSAASSATEAALTLCGLQFASGTVNQRVVGGSPTAWSVAGSGSGSTGG